MRIQEEHFYDDSTTISGGRRRNWGSLPSALTAPLFWQRAAAAADPKRGLPVLVVIELSGGNDGLNTVVPYRDDLYAKARPSLRIEPKAVLKLDDHVGLNPALKDLHKLWESGDLAVVQGAGYPNPNRSHTRSMEIWQTGSVGPVPDAGWLGRGADAEPRLGRVTWGVRLFPWPCGDASGSRLQSRAWPTTGCRRGCRTGMSQCQRMTWRGRSAGEKSRRLPRRSGWKR